MIAVPQNWNGTLALYSHGYTPANVPLANPAPDAPDTPTAHQLLQEGYALAGSSYSQNGWAVQQAFNDDIALLNFFDSTCGRPTRTVAWGDSMGGMITAGLVQLFPQRFMGAAPMCGLLGGSVGLFNVQLDGLFAFNLLLANGSLQVVNFTDPTTELGQAEAILAQAQQTAAGRARIALFSALEDVPDWFTTGTPEPSPTDYAAQENNQFLAAQVDLFFDIVAMAEAEGRAGGNYSWNTGVNYFHQFPQSIDQRETAALYQQAGLNLQTDLATIQNAPRISADPQAVEYMRKYIVFNGNIKIPVLTAHTTGDPLVFVQDEEAYARIVQAEGNAQLLHQVFVDRAGHCAFTSAENVTIFHTLIHRVEIGRWGNTTDPSRMNQEATALGSALNVLPLNNNLAAAPAFIKYRPAPFLRPYFAEDRGIDSHS
jgi:pimeloyl-ACP methyl ester carboxylesterase